MNRAKLLPSPFKFAAISTAAVLIFGSEAQAASSSWITTNTGAFQTWANTSGDWSSGVPGAAAGSTTNGDTATFAGTAGATTISIDSGRNVQNLSFTGGGGTGVYTFTGGPLVLTSGGSISVVSAATGAGNVYFASSITLEGNYTFSNSNNSAYLAFGGNGGTNPLLNNSAAILKADANLGSVTLTLNGTSGTQPAAGQVITDGYTGISNKITDGTNSQVSILKSGPGTWELNNSSSTYSGTTTIDGGVINVETLANGGSVSSIGSSSNLATNLIFNGGTLQFNGYTGASGGDGNGVQSTDRLFTIGDATGSGNSATLDSSAMNFTAINSNLGTVNFTNPGKIAFYAGTTGAHSLVLTGFNLGTNTFAPQLTDQVGGGVAPTSVTKTNQGTWILTGSNTYTGLTSILGGILRDGSTTGTGISASSTVLINNGTYESATNISRGLGQSGDDVYITGGLAGFSANNGSNTPITVTINNSGNPLQFGSTNFSPTVFILNGVAANTALTLADGLDLNGGSQTIGTFASTATISGAITSSVGTGTLEKIGAGTLVLNGTNTYTGGTGVGAGVLSIGSGSSIGTGGAVVGATGELRLSSTSNIASGQTVNVNSGGIIGIASNGFTPGSGAGGLATIIAPGSSGGLAIDVTGPIGYNQNLDMTAIGNGNMLLGSSIGTSSSTGGVYSGTSLTVGKGGSENSVPSGPAIFGTTYHLGGGGGWLTITGANLLADQPSVFLGTNSTNALFTSGQGGVTYAATSNTRSGLVVGNGGVAGQGTLDLANNQSYTGLTTVNTGSVLALDFSDTYATPTANTNILNSGNEVDLNGGTLDVIGNGTSASQTLSRIGLGVGGTDTIVASGKNTTLNLGILGSGTAGGTLTANNGASVLISPTGTGTSSITTTTTTNAADGTYGGQVVYQSGSNYTWATGTSSGISGGNTVYSIGAYNGDAANTFVNAGTTATQDYVVTTTATNTLTASETVNLLRMSGTSATSTITTATGKELFVGAGGVLFTGANTNTLAGGFVTTGTAANSGGYNFLDLQNYSTGTVGFGGAQDNGGHTVVVFGGTGFYSAVQSTANTGGYILNGATLGFGSAPLNVATTGVFTINSGTIDGQYNNGTGDVIAANFLLNGNFTLGQADELGVTATLYDFGSQGTANGTILLNNNITITVNSDSSTWDINAPIGDGGYNNGLTVNAVSGLVQFGAATNDTFTGPLVLEAGGGATGASNVQGPIGSGLFQIGSTTTNRNNVVYLGAGTTSLVANGATWTAAGFDDLGVGSSTEFIKDNSTTGAITLSLWGSGQYSFGGTIVDGTTTGKANVTMNGTGTQTLTGSNSYTGATTAAAGTIMVDASHGGSLASASTLTLAGGTFALKGATGGTVQNLGAVTASAAGGSTIAVDNNGGATSGSTTLNLGTFSTVGVGGSVDVVASNSVTPAGTTPTITTTSPNIATVGVVGTAGHVVYTNNSGTTWATATSVGVGQYSIGAYTLDTTALLTTGGTNTTNYVLTNSAQVQTAATTTGLLRISNTAAGSLDLSGKGLIIGQTGLLFNSGSSFAINDSVGTGSLQGSANIGLIIQNYGTGANTALTINSTIANDGTTTPNTLTIAGPGSTVLTGTNTYGGITYLNNGNITFYSLKNFGTGSANVVFSGATLKYGTGNTADLSQTSFGKTVVVNAAGATIDTNGNSMEYDGNFGSGVGGVTFVDTASVHGTININNNTGYTGFTTIGAGANVNLGNNGNLTTGSTALAGTIVASGGTLSGGTTQATNSSQGAIGSENAGKITLQAGGVLSMGNLTGTQNNPIALAVGLGTGGKGNQQINAANNVMNAQQLTWNAGGVLKFSLDSTPQQGTALNPSASTLLNLGTGALVKVGTGSFTLNFQNTGAYNVSGNSQPDGSGTPTDYTNVYDLINFGVINTYGVLTPNTNFNIDDFSITNLDGVGTLSFYYNPYADGGLGQEELLLTVVPEPSTWAMLLGGLVALVFWTRKRSRRAISAA